jgi:hypothetical protein
MGLVLVFNGDRSARMKHKVEKSSERAKFVSSNERCDAQLNKRLTGERGHCSSMWLELMESELTKKDKQRLWMSEKKRYKNERTAKSRESRHRFFPITVSRVKISTLALYLNEFHPVAHFFNSLGEKQYILSRSRYFLDLTNTGIRLWRKSISCDQAK